jgi:hypothetical protein
VHLSEEARRLNKTVGSLESAAYHCRVIYKYISKKFIYVFIERELALQFNNLDDNYRSCEKANEKSNIECYRCK